MMMFLEFLERHRARHLFRSSHLKEKTMAMTNTQVFEAKWEMSVFEGYHALTKVCT